MRCVGVWFIVLSPVNEKLLVSCGLCEGGAAGVMWERGQREWLFVRSVFSLSVWG